MHDTAYRFGKLFFENYITKPVPLILDVGSADVNGSLRVTAPHDSMYVGVDIAADRGVDLVLDDPHVFPFKSGTFDAVISTSCFEHDVMFWLTFQEIARVTATGGYIYINAPSNGMVHRYPADCWRFYPDAALALASWSTRQGTPLTLLESFVAPPEGDMWMDCVMVFGKDAPSVDKPISQGLSNIILGQLGTSRDALLPKEYYLTTSQTHHDILPSADVPVSLPRVDEFPDLRDVVDLTPSSL